MKTEIDYLREFIVTWKVNYASLQCKKGVFDVSEVEKGTQSKVFFNEKKLMTTSFLVEEVLTLEELLKHTGHELIDNFIMDDILNFDFSDKFEDETLIDEYLKNVYDDETIFFYERKEYLGIMIEPTSVYYVQETKIDDNIMEILKKLDFTGKFFARKGLLK